MGPRHLQPERPPDLPFTFVPQEERGNVKFLVASSFLQNLEGELDTAHVSFLHAALDDGSASLASLVKVNGYNNDRHPRLSVINTDYGFVYGGRRQRTDGDYCWRVTRFLFPFYPLIPIAGGYTGGATIWVPIDDHHCWRFLVGGRRQGSNGGGARMAAGPRPGAASTRRSAAGSTSWRTGW